MLIKMSPPSLSKFDTEDGVKLVGIVALSDFTKDYLIKQKIIPIIIHQSILYELLSNLIGSLLLYYDFILH